MAEIQNNVFNDKLSVKIIETEGSNFYPQDGRDRELTLEEKWEQDIANETNPEYIAKKELEEGTIGKRIIFIAPYLYEIKEATRKECQEYIKKAVNKIPKCSFAMVSISVTPTLEEKYQIQQEWNEKRVNSKGQRGVNSITYRHRQEVIDQIRKAKKELKSGETRVIYMDRNHYPDIGAICMS